MIGEGAKKSREEGVCVDGPRGALDERGPGASLRYRQSVLYCLVLQGVVWLQAHGGNGRPGRKRDEGWRQVNKARYRDTYREMKQ